MNVLLIVSDDLNDELGCYGSERAVTPHLDRLARMSLRFDRAYAQYPVCVQSRNSFLSGLRFSRDGLQPKWENLRQMVPHVTTLPQLFREQGYYTASVGKVFHVDGWDARWPDDGWEYCDELSWDFRINCPPANQGAARKPPFPREGKTLKWPGHSGAIDYGMISYEDDLYHDDGQATQEAIRQLDRHHTQPFFLAVGYRRPHAPFVAPEKYFAPYPLNSIQLPPPGDRSDVPEIAFATTPPNYGEPEQMKLMKMCYLASVSFLDSQVGRLLRALEERGLLENTIIVFMSDHGFSLGEHGDWHKFTLFEKSARVPLIIRVPGVTRANSKSSQLVELVDLYPTLMDLCGLAGPNQTLHGQSLVPILHAPGTELDHDPALTIVVRGPKTAPTAVGYSLRTPRYRYNEWWSTDLPAQLLASELYDHQTDPEEEFNLAANKDMQPVRKALSQEMTQYR